MSTPLQLGSLSLKSKAILCPLERVSDVGFRRLCFQNGAALTWTEMIYASEFSKRSRQALAQVDTHDNETLTGIQFLVDRTASKDNWGVDTLHRALETLEEGIVGGQNPEWKNIVAIDLNFGCPSPNLVKRGAGPSQMRRRSKIKNLFEALSQWKKSTTTLPNIQAVGAKIRLGLNPLEQRHQVYLPVAEAAATCGLDYLVVHARNAKEKSRSKPTWKAIGEVKEVVGDSDLKIIGNGNVLDKKDMEKMMKMTNCDGVMVGRAAMKNPWCFREFLSSEDDPQTTRLLPTMKEFQAAYAEYQFWSANQPAYSYRYKPFHDENFQRIRSEILQRQRQK